MVIAILGTLMGLSVVVMNGIAEQAERDATKVTIRKVNALLRDRMEAFDRSYRGDIRRTFVVATVQQINSTTGANGYFDQTLVTPDQAEAGIVTLARKLGFRYYFPQRMAERTAIDGDSQVTGVSDVIYVRLLAPAAEKQLIDEGNPSPTESEILARATSNWTTNHTQETESAELLYFSLINSATFGASQLDGDQFEPSEVADTDGDGLPEFVDRWGQPLRYYRWPTRIARRTDAPHNLDVTQLEDNSDLDETVRQIAGTQLRGLPQQTFILNEIDPIKVDPDDPAGLLATFLLKYSNAPPVGLVDLNMDLEITPLNYHDLDTFHAPMILSAGVDGDVGLYEPYDETNYGYLANWANTDAAKDAMFDNVTNRSAGAGGAR